MENSENNYNKSLDGLWKPIDPYEVEMTLLAYCFRSPQLAFRILLQRFNYDGIFEDRRASLLAGSLRCLSVYEESFKHPTIVSELCHQMSLRCDNLWEANVLVREIVERREELNAMPPNRIKQLATRGLLHLSLRADRIEMENAKKEDL
ncbi:hypothetical protein QEH56_21170 [Pelagicoccus enzymogenes]|uniref:hypothetical protein n=1 Tax=Pelagicoccus enzymogenes TaxID=2773457 RepID=UPI00280EC8E9|nr:hypothetical protein [Pelagicoccus enzymogenes]MDQ8200692.1 hypothetical protein [Pelagicoccus enzymogenes]